MPPHVSRELQLSFFPFFLFFVTKIHVFLVLLSLATLSFSFFNRSSTSICQVGLEPTVICLEDRCLYHLATNTLLFSYLATTSSAIRCVLNNKDDGCILNLVLNLPSLPLLLETSLLITTVTSSFLFLLTFSSKNILFTLRT